MKLRNLDHVVVIVTDLDAAKTFFLALGLKVEGEQEVADEWADRVTGLDGMKASVVLHATAGRRNGPWILSRFDQPVAVGGEGPAAPNTPGICHLCFAVEQIEAVVARLKARGAAPFSEIQPFEDTYKLVYARGPEGLIVELAERIG